MTYLILQPEIDSLKSDLHKLERALKKNNASPDDISTRLSELKLKADGLNKKSEASSFESIANKQNPTYDRLLKKHDIGKIRKQLKKLLQKNKKKRDALIKHAEQYKLPMSLVEGFEAIDEINQLIKIMKKILLPGNTNF